MSWLSWYWVWGRHRSDIDHALPELRSRWAQPGLRSLLTPAVRFGVETPEEARASLPPIERIAGPGPSRRVVVALANPDTEADRVRLGRYLATGAEAGGEVLGVHLVRAPARHRCRSRRPRWTTTSATWRRRSRPPTGRWTWPVTATAR